MSGARVHMCTPPPPTWLACPVCGFIAVSVMGRGPAFSLALHQRMWDH